MGIHGKCSRERLLLGNIKELLKATRVPKRGDSLTIDPR